MTIEQLHAQKYPVDPNYKAVLPVKQFNMAETIDQYFDRSFRVIKGIIEYVRSDVEAKNSANANILPTIMVIAHAGTYLCFDMSYEIHYN